MPNYAEFAKEARALADRMELIPDGWSGEDDLQTLQAEVQDLADALGDALEQVHQATADEDEDEEDAGV